MNFRTAGRRAFVLRGAVAVGAPLWLGLGGAAPRALAAPVGAETIDVLRRGGVVAAFRHAQAPGNFDPPGFKLGDCSTQRNLGDAGREQARQLGAWFRAQKLVPTRVRSSPWCRCLDTARLAFGAETPSRLDVESWDALSSTQQDTTTAATQVEAMQRALGAVPARSFEVWVSHQSTLGQLVGAGTSSGEGLLLRAGADGKPRVVARFQPA